MSSATSARLRERAARAPAELALVSCAAGQARTWTWAELDQATVRISDRISRAMPGPRCVLLTSGGNDAATVLDLIGMLRTEAPLAILSPAAPHLEVRAVADALLRQGHDVVEVRQGQATAHRSGSQARRPLPDESVLLATGGSSGRPRLVADPMMRTVGKRPAATRPSAVMNWRSGQRQMVAGPLYHSASLTFFVEGLCDGNTIIVQRNFNPLDTLHIIEEWHVEWLQLTPYHLRHLALAMRRCQPELSSIRGLLHLAAPCPAGIKRFWIEQLGAEYVFELYGATEGIGLTLARGDEWLRRPGTVGQGFFTRIRILDDDGNPLPPGEPGQVFMRSGSLTYRPYVDAADSISTDADGFASVGDRGWLDEDEYLYLAARQLTRIQVGGETVDPSEVEAILLQHPDVLDAAVAGVRDDRLGESLVAMVVSAGARDAGALKRYLRERVARWKVPRVVRFVDDLPYTEAGKLDRPGLTAVVERAAQAPVQP